MDGFFMHGRTGCIGKTLRNPAENSCLNGLRLTVLLCCLLFLTSCGSATDEKMNGSEQGDVSVMSDAKPQTEANASAKKDGQTSEGQSESSPMQNASLTASEMPKAGMAKIPVQVGFSEGDFSVPRTSNVSATIWQTFLAENMEQAFVGDSRRDSLHEVFRFESSLMAEEEAFWQVSWLVATIAHIPGWNDKNITRGLVVHEIIMEVREDSNRLFLENMTSLVHETVVPERVLQVLRTAMRDWQVEWHRATGTSSEAVPTIHEQVRAIPFSNLSEGFIPPQSGEAYLDLTGSGIQENIHLLFEENGVWQMEVNGVQAEGLLYSPVGAYVLDLDERDRQREVALSGYSSGGELITELYTLRNERFFQVGSVPGHLFDGNGMGRISSWSEALHGPFEGMTHRLEFVLDTHGEIRMVPTRWYLFDLEAELLMDLPLYAEPDSERSGVLFPKGSQIRIVLGDVAAWFRIINAAGETGWIRFVNETELLLPGGEVTQGAQVLLLQDP